MKKQHVNDKNLWWLTHLSHKKRVSNIAKVTLVFFPLPPCKAQKMISCSGVGQCSWHWMIWLLLLSMTTIFVYTYEVNHDLQIFWNTCSLPVWTCIRMSIGRQMLFKSHKSLSTLSNSLPYFYHNRMARQGKALYKAQGTRYSWAAYHVHNTS